MARPTKLTPTVVADIHARRRRGETWPVIAKALGMAEATVRTGGRLPDPNRAELAAKAAPVGSPRETPATSDEIPKDAEAAEISRWIEEVEAAAQAEKRAGNIAAFGSLMAKLVSLAEHRRKIAPPPRDNPDDNPDFAAAKERARQALRALVTHPLIKKWRL